MRLPFPSESPVSIHGVQSREYKLLYTELTVLAFKQLSECCVLSQELKKRAVAALSHSLWLWLSRACPGAVQNHQDEMRCGALTGPQ